MKFIERNSNEIYNENLHINIIKNKLKCYLNNDLNSLCVVKKLSSIYIDTSLPLSRLSFMIKGDLIFNSYSFVIRDIDEHILIRIPRDKYLPFLIKGLIYIIIAFILFIIKYLYSSYLIHYITSNINNLI